MKPFRLTTMFLILLNAGLGVLVITTWTRGQARVSEPRMLDVQPLSLPDLAPLNSIPMHSVEVEAIREQVLFYASRTFYRAPVQPVQIPPPNYELAGTMRLANGKRLAFVRSKVDQSSRTVHTGDELDGWSVQSVDPDRIVLNRSEQVLELRTSKSTGSQGLVRGSVAQHVAHTGIRVLRGTARTAAPANVTVVLNQPRVFQPPTPIGK